MLDDFFVRALIAGVGLAIAAGPLGCFVVWRRMAYLGDTMAHSALLGIALSLLLEFDLTVGVFAVAILISLLVYVMQKKLPLPTDAVLGILSHSTLAIGLVLVSLMTWLRIDLLGLLFGDILSVSLLDLGVIGIAVITVLGGVLIYWRPLLAGTLSEELAQAEGLNPNRSRLVLMLVLAVLIAVAMKIVGVLLITSLLIIPAATARIWSRGPEMMAICASAIGIASVFGGLYGSLHWDTPSGPSIVVAALGFFMVSQLWTICKKGGTQ